MHAFIIAHQQPSVINKTLSQELLSKLNLPIAKQAPHPDVKFISPDTTSISIKTIRDLKPWLYQKPFSLAKKAVVINQADTLTLQAQNALLKSLEEPPQNTYIYLTTTNPGLLLVTITSRCQLITPKGTISSSTKAMQIPSISQLTPGERINLAGEHSRNRDQALQFCQDLLANFKTNLKNPQIILTAITQLKANTNPKLTLENLLLSC